MGPAFPASSPGKQCHGPGPTLSSQGAAQVTLRHADVMESTRCWACQGSPWTHRDLRAPGVLPVEAEHDDLQAMAAVGALEEARPDQVVRVAGREVDAAVGQAVAAGGAGSMRAWPQSRTGAGAGVQSSCTSGHAA